MSIIEPDQRIKIFSQNTDKLPVGFGVPSDVVITGNSVVNNLLGVYSLVLARYNIEPKPLPVDSFVIGDTAFHVFRLKVNGDFDIDPESDTFNGVGESDNWTDVTFKEQVLVAIANKTAILWNNDVSPLLVHPVSMFGSDGKFYNSVLGGTLTDDPVNGNVANWILFLDPASGVIFPGFTTYLPVSTVPGSYFEENGDLISKALFPALYDFLKDGTSEGIYGETTTDFNLRDMRGQFARGWDHGRGLDPGADAKVFQGDTINSDPQITNITLGSLNVLELGMLIEGTGIIVGTVITLVDYANSLIEVFPSPTADNVALTITGHSRTNRGDGVTDDNVGTVQLSTYQKHDHTDGDHTHLIPNFAKPVTDGNDDARTFQSEEISQNPTSEPSRLPLIDFRGSEETRGVNINGMWVIKS